MILNVLMLTKRFEDEIAHQSEVVVPYDILVSSQDQDRISSSRPEGNCIPVRRIKTVARAHSLQGIVESQRRRKLKNEMCSSI